MRTIFIISVCLILNACNYETKLDQIEQNLMKVDLAFSDLSKEVGMQRAFKAYCADEGVLLRSNTMPIVGKNEVITSLEQVDDSSFELTWKPLYASAARSGELGYTYGVYALKVKEADLTTKGTYVSIWRKEKGLWKFVLDSGNEGVGE